LRARTSPGDSSRPKAAANARVAPGLRLVHL